MKKRLLTTLLIATMTLVTACGNAEVPAENDTTATTVSVTEQITEQVTEPQTELPTEKEKHEDIDGYEYAEFDKFNSYAKDNGLENTKIYIKGTIKSVSDLTSAEMSTTDFSISTGDKEGWIALFVFVPYKEKMNTFFKGKEVTCFGTYMGWSDVMLKPSILADKIIVDGKTYTTSDIVLVGEGYTSTEEKTEAVTTTPTELPTLEPTKKTTEKIEKVLFEGNEIKITYKGITSDGFYHNVNVKIENNSDRDYIVQVDDVSVNGYMIDPIFSCDVKSGKKANDKISFFDSDLEENDIKEIKDIELSFHVYNDDEWEDRFDTEMIKIQV